MQECFVPRLIEIGLVVLEKKMKNVESLHSYRLRTGQDNLQSRDQPLESTKRYNYLDFELI